MNEEKLLEREARSSLDALGDRLRSVDHPDRITQRGDSRHAQEILGQVFPDQRKERVEMCIDDPANHLEGKTFGSRIDREDLSALDYIVVLA